jgi:hypothetical protein
MHCDLGMRIRLLTRALSNAWHLEGFWTALAFAVVLALVLH